MTIVHDHWVTVRFVWSNQQKADKNLPGRVVTYAIASVLLDYYYGCPVNSLQSGFVTNSRRQFDTINHSLNTLTNLSGVDNSPVNDDSLTVCHSPSHTAGYLYRIVFVTNPP